ncbi:MAG: M48 family metallopeptidase, partial [Pseudomonadota bacterium]|nr:M48 family metallopeptidase [Pseudomonadota bacterium]
GRGRAAGQPRSIVLGQREISYLLQRSTRRRTIGLRIDNHGLRVCAPAWTGEPEIEQALAENARWVLGKLKEWSGRPDAALAAREFVDGAPLLWLGQTVTLRCVPARLAIPRPLALEEPLASIPIAEDSRDPAAAVAAWYMVQALPWFRRRAQLFAERLGRAPREIRLTGARGRWGSCTGKGVIRLNWRLMQASPAEIDYVVAHEMAHLIELNHSSAFWAVVAQLMPDWAAASDRLDARDREYRAL